MSSPVDFHYEPKFDMEVYFPTTCSDQDIRQLEQDLNATFTKDYVAFLKQWNGVKFYSEIDYPVMVKPMESFPGQSDEEWYEDEEDFLQILELFGVDRTKPDGIRERQSDYGFNRRVPPEYISIGAYHGPFAIAMHRKTGEIYGWWGIVPADSEDKGQPTMDFMRKVGDSFHEFWNRLDLAPDV